MRSTKSQSMCAMIRWVSWMRAVESELTVSDRSAIAASRPPRPVMATVAIFFSPAASMPFKTFAELPLVLMPTKRDQMPAALKVEIVVAE